MAGYVWMKLEMPGNGLESQEWLEITGISGNGWKWMEMDGNVYKCVEMD